MKRVRSGVSWFTVTVNLIANLCFAMSILSDEGIPLALPAMGMIVTGALLGWQLGVLWDRDNES